MKLRKVKRLVRRTKKQLERGTFKGRIAPVSREMAGAIFVVANTSGYAVSVLKPTMADYILCVNKDGSYLVKGHKHWIKPQPFAYKEAVAVSYA